MWSKLKQQENHPKVFETKHFWSFMINDNKNNNCQIKLHVRYRYIFFLLPFTIYIYLVYHFNLGMHLYKCTFTRMTSSCDVPASCLIWTSLVWFSDSVALNTLSYVRHKQYRFLNPKRFICGFRLPLIFCWCRLL